MPSALDAALGITWAIEQRALEDMLRIAARENEVTPEALEKYRAEAAARGERLDKREDVAILRVTGPLFRRANLFTQMSGATSYEILAKDLQAALDDPSIESVLIDIDSPGGDANGVGELASMVHEARDVKRTVAYVGGTAASAAYWLASAASEVVIDASAMLGSIGVVLGVRDTSEADKARGIYEIVSSQSPSKRPNPATEEGRSDLQRIADEMADVFIGAVAKYRGASINDVIAGYGRGSVLIGEKAVKAGMADRLGSFEEVLASLKGSGRQPGRFSNRSSTKGIAMSDQEKPKSGGDQDLDKIRAEAAAAAVKADRERRTAVMALDEAKGREALAEHLLASTEMTPDQIKAALAASPKAEEKPEPKDEPEADPEGYDKGRVEAAKSAPLRGDPKPTERKGGLLAMAKSRYQKEA